MSRFFCLVKKALLFIVGAGGSYEGDGPSSQESSTRLVLFLGDVWCSLVRARPTQSIIPFLKILPSRFILIFINRGMGNTLATTEKQNYYCTNLKDFSPFFSLQISEVCVLPTTGFCNIARILIILKVNLLLWHVNPPTQMTART